MKNNKSDLIKKYLSKVKSANKELTKKEAFKDLLNRLYVNIKIFSGLLIKLLPAEKQF